MTRDELRRAIEGPARRVGVTFEPGLPDRILADMGQESGRLPLLSFLLEQLWQLRRGAVLTHEAYGTMGGVEGAIATVAEGVFDRLPEREKESPTQALLPVGQRQRGIGGYSTAGYDNDSGRGGSAPHQTFG